jgi:hypothetical protein
LAIRSLGDVATVEQQITARLHGMADLGEFSLHDRGEQTVIGESIAA